MMALVVVVVQVVYVSFCFAGYVAALVPWQSAGVWYSNYFTFRCILFKFHHIGCTGITPNRCTLHIFAWSVRVHLNVIMVITVFRIYIALYYSSHPIYTLMWQ